MAFGATSLASCVQIPPRDGIAAADVNAVIRRIKCDLNTIVLQKAYSPVEGRQPFLFLRSWAAKVHLTLVVDDSAQLTPGASYTAPLRTVNGVAQTFTLGVGGGLTTEVQRQEDVEFLVSFKDVDTENNNGQLATPLYHYCQPEPGILLESDLGLKSLVDAALKPVESGVLKPGNNVGPNVGPPAPIPKADYPKLGKVEVRPVNPAEAPQESINRIAAKLPKNELVSKQLLQRFNISPEVAEMTGPQLDEQNPPEKGDAETVKKLLSNSVDATAIETKTQAIINDIVKPRYSIAQSSLDASCLGPITQSQFEAIAQSANVSTFVVRADKAAERAASKTATSADIAQALTDSAQALDDANSARNAVIEKTNQMAGQMADCTLKTKQIKAAAKKQGPPLYDPISVISETINFYVTVTGSVAPTWKLVRVTAPTSANLLSGTRKDTNTLILSMGRPSIGANGEVKASDAMNNQILYSILGQAISTTRP